MAINDRQGKDLKPYSLTHIFNQGFDQEFQVPVFELLNFDPLTNALKRVTTNAMGEYSTNDVEEVGAVTYIGKEDPDGGWYVQKIDTTSGTSIRYASVSNNPSIGSYTAAWTDRTTLTYGTYSEAF